MNLSLITIKKLANESGYTESAIRSKIADGIFAEGKHYIKSPDGRIQFRVDEYIRWVESSSTATAFKSRSTGTQNATAQR